MTDYFALLGEARRPWLEPDQLKEKFLALSRELHPDRNQSESGGEGHDKEDKGFTEINAAYNCLRDPRDRLRHLLQLELGNTAKPAQSVPSRLMDRSLEVGTACRAADQFLGKRHAQSSALLKAQMFEDGQEVADKLMALQQKLEKGRAELLDEVRKLDAGWAGESASGRASALARLGEIESLLGFTGRWISQLQERVVRLAL